MRHAASGAPHFLARYLPTPIINAGDGTHEHPTQALLDARTILDHRPSLEGLRVAIIGDIAHSRVARSNVHLLSKFGANVVLCGPAPLLPPQLATLAPNVSLTYDIREAIAGADVIMMLRVQLERQHADAVSAGRLFQVLRAAAGPFAVGQAGRDCDASGADQPGPGDLVRGSGLEAVGDFESSGERHCGTDGGA
jgi:aspartate carbamoyltransferase catalytic subunit